MNTDPVREWLIRCTPLEPSLLQGPGFVSAISERVAATGAHDTHEYAALLHERPEERNRLISLIAVPESWLFRYPRSFELLRQHLLRWKDEGLPALRMVSLGCAAGQEPCSAAITALSAGWDATNTTIVAVDQNQDLLNEGSRGRFSAAPGRVGPPAWAEPWLTERDGLQIVDERALSMIRWLHADITEWQFETTPHVVFCRNVLIYLREAARAEVLRRIHRVLADDGLLLVGHAEHAVREIGLFRPIDFSLSFAYRMPERTRPASPTNSGSSNAKAGMKSTRDAASPDTGSARASSAADDTHAEPRVATLERARELADSGEAATAECILRSLLAENAAQPDALELLGSVLLSRGREEEARSCFERAAEAGAVRDTTLFHIAALLEKAGRHGDAATYWARLRDRGHDPAGEVEA